MALARAADLSWGQISKHSKMTNYGKGSHPDAGAKSIKGPLNSQTASWIRSLSFLTAYFCEQGL